MENKYYIPTVEEFYIGFEHEILYKGKFEPLTVTSWPDFEDIHYALNLDSVRVKYLDREDIESLGFKFKESAKSLNDTSSHFFDIYTLANDIQLSHYNWYTGSSDTDYIEHRGVRIIYLPDNVDMVMFRGNIKNKSELVKLLKQLGIK